MFQDAAQPSERPMERDVDQVPTDAHELGDLGCPEARVVQGEQLPIALAELRSCLREGQPPDDLLLGVVDRSIAGGIEREVDRCREALVETAPSDPEQPGDRLTLSRIVARRVANSALENVARDVLGIGARPNPIRDVRVERSGSAAPAPESGSRPIITVSTLGPIYGKAYPPNGSFSDLWGTMDRGQLEQLGRLELLVDLERGGERVQAARLGELVCPRLPCARESEVEAKVPNFLAPWRAPCGSLRGRRAAG